METAVRVVKCFVPKMRDRNHYFSLFPPTPLRDNLLPLELAEGAAADCLKSTGLFELMEQNEIQP